MSNKQKEELQLILDILKRMYEFEKSLKEGIEEECFTKEQCSDVMNSIPKSREYLINRRDYLKKLLSDNN